jgi:ubiquinone/menaquinone biosynthesis C-methylase UbiE
MKKILDSLFARQPHVCPWWCCFTFDNPIRRLFHDPIKMLSPFVRPGFSVVDIGPGMGYFTVPLCHLVGNEGKVLALDIQQKMLDAVRKRASREKVVHRLVTQVALQGSLNIPVRADFVLAFWMVHEVPAKERFFEEIAHALKDDGSFLMVEPLIHVTSASFSGSIDMATKAGLRLTGSPRVALSRSALFKKDR